MHEQTKNRLLIVDDSPMNLAKLTQTLKSEYIIFTATDGASAIESAKTNKPDLILLDIILPDKDGYRVFFALRSSKKTEHIPVIFITGLGDHDSEIKGLKFGAVDYINKPFNEGIVKLRVRHQMKIINQFRTIERLSMTDQLTEIPNRRNFDNQLHYEWKRAEREQISIGLMMVDVDHFKKYNDTYGHQQGDKALCFVAEVLRQTLKRTTDFVARWGGEEFVVLLSNTNEDGCLIVGEKIRQNIENETTTQTNRIPSKLTVSVGISIHMPTRGSSLYEFISQADKALYMAKNTGRNKICLYPGDAT